MQNGGNPGVRGVWVLTHQGGRRAVRRARGIQHHRARTGRCELLAIVWIGQKGQGVRIRASERGDAVDASRRVATTQLAPETDCELSQ